MAQASNLPVVGSEHNKSLLWLMADVRFPPNDFNWHYIASYVCSIHVTVCVLINCIIIIKHVITQQWIATSYGTYIKYYH